MLIHYFGRPATNLRQHQFGATLLEVLVAILLLSLGFLAVASVHASAFKYGKLSQFHSAAVNLGATLIDHMRANAAGVGAKSYVSASSAYPATAPSADCSDPASSCDPAMVAQSDLAEVIKQANLDLPGGDVYVRQNVSITGATAYEVWVRWEDPQTTGSDQTGNIADKCPGDTTGQLSCVLLTALF